MVLTLISPQPSGVAAKPPFVTEHVNPLKSRAPAESDGFEVSESA